jgi:hypothetical protein
MKLEVFTTLLNQINHHCNGAILMTWFEGQAADFYGSRIQKLIPRINKYLDNAGDYVEK